MSEKTIEMYLNDAKLQRQFADEKFNQTSNLLDENKVNHDYYLKEIGNTLKGIYHMLDALYHQNEAIISQNERKTG